MLTFTNMALLMLSIHPFKENQMKWWLRFERAVHRVDAYLARQRYDVRTYCDCRRREHECTRLLDKLEITK